MKITLTLVLIFVCSICAAQNIKIGSDGLPSNEASAILELDGATNSQGFTIPQMTEVQRVNFATSLVSSPNGGEGIMVYQTDGEAGIYYWEGNRWIKYKPYGYSGIVGTNWDTLANGGAGGFAFISYGDGFTGTEINTGTYNVSFDTPFDSYPIITLTGEANKVALPEDLPIVPPVCNPNYIADCSAPFNASHIEAFRLESYVDLDGPGGNPIEMQVLQNGEGFLPPVGTNANDIWPYPTNAAGGAWMTTGIGYSAGLPSAGDYVSQLAGGAWGSLSGCSTNGQDPCVIQNGNGNHGKYYPSTDVTSSSFCNQIYHPSDQGASQTNQLTVRLGKGPNDYFRMFMESARNWPDEMVCWIDWNRDGDFTDAGEAIAWVPQFPGGQTPNGNYSMPHQMPVEPGALSGPNSSPLPGQHAVPPNAELGLTTIRILSDWLVTNLVDKPCITSVWGESEDYIVEIYDATQGSVIGSGNNFAYTPAVCGTQVLGSSGNYTGFRVECTSVLGNLINTRVHFDVTKNTIY